MPRVYLTASQKEEAANRQYLERLAKGLLIYKAVNRMTAKQLAEDLKINIRTLNKLVNVESVALSTDKLRKVLEVAGMGVASFEQYHAQM